MIGDSSKTISYRFYYLLAYQLMAQMPRPGGIHKYSKGGMLAGFRMYTTATGYQIVMSEGVQYSTYAMGYDKSGTKRNPRGPLEKINFQTIEKCVKSVASIVTSSIGGNVKYD